MRRHVLESIFLIIALACATSCAGPAKTETATRPNVDTQKSDKMEQRPSGPQISDTSFDIPLDVDLISGRVVPYGDPLQNVFNLLAIYRSNDQGRVTTDLSISGTDNLKGKNGFVIFTYPVTVASSPRTLIQPKVLSHTGIFTPLVESMAGVSLADHDLSIPRGQLDTFISEVRRKGIPLGKDSYGLNFYGIKAEMEFAVDNDGKITRATLKHIDISSSVFNKQYTTNAGMPIQPRIISVEDLIRRAR